MEFNELVASFASRHNVSGLAIEDGAATVDIDGIVVTMSSDGTLLVLAAEIGEPPAEGAGVFADLLLEANLQSDVFFAKTPESGPYVIVRRLGLQPLNGETFDAALEAFVNQAETWCRLLADFRPAARSAANRDEADLPSFGSAGFLQV